MTKTNVLAICGSLREVSFHRMLCASLQELAPDGMEVKQAPSFAGFPLFNADILDASGLPDDVEAFVAAIRDADAVVIASPEYNFSVPGALKNALDWVSRAEDQPFKGKPVALQSASPGLLGGSRAQYHLRQVLVYLDARVVNKPEIFIPLQKEKFDIATGRLTDEPTREFVSNQLKSLAQLAAS